MFYGVPADEDITDVEWLGDVGRLGWVVFMKDERIRRRPAEKAALIEHAIKCFVIARGDLPAEEMGRRFIVNLAAIEVACASSGPFIYAVHDSRITKLKLD